MAKKFPYYSTPIKYTYLSSTRYREEFGIKPTFTISYTTNSRTDRQTTGQPNFTKYTFDSKGRLIRTETNDFYPEIILYYYYDGEMLPYKSNYEGDSDEHATHYEYLMVDEQGNWTERRVSGKLFDEDDYGNTIVEPYTITETRTITYY